MTTSVCKPISYEKRRVKDVLTLYDIVYTKTGWNTTSIYEKIHINQYFLNYTSNSQPFSLSSLSGFGAPIAGIRRSNSLAPFIRT